MPQVEHRLGLRHADISFSNVFVDDGRLTLFASRSALVLGQGRPEIVRAIPGHGFLSTG